MNVTPSLLVNLPVLLDSGQDLLAWADYDGATDLLEVRLSDVDSRPVASVLSYGIDLVGVLGTPKAFAGFASGVGPDSADKPQAVCSRLARFLNSAACQRCAKNADGEQPNVFLNMCENADWLV